MAFNRSLRLHTLHVNNVLPFYDAVFAVAFTLLAYNLPDHLSKMMAGNMLKVSIAIYALVGIAVFIYWLKLRRLMLLDRFLQPWQLSLVGLGLMIVMILPKLVSLVLQHGAGSGNLLQWSQAQVVNTLCLSFLVLFNLICLLYASSLRRRKQRRKTDAHLLDGIVTTQKAGVLLNILMIGLELSFDWFETQYIYLIPITLISEEIYSSLRFSQTQRR